MNNGKLSIAPGTYSEQKINQTTGAYEGSNTIPHQGLTKREYFAGLAMQGWLSTHFTSQDSGWEIADKDKIAKWSVDMADELLKELEQ